MEDADWEQGLPFLNQGDLDPAIVPFATRTVESGKACFEKRVRVPSGTSVMVGKVRVGDRQICYHITWKKQGAIIGENHYYANMPNLDYLSYMSQMQQISFIDELEEE